jgi:hypothetical protein
MKLPKVETLIIFVFFGCVGLWAASKCSSQRAVFVRQAEEPGDEEQDNRPQRRDTVVVQQPAQPQSVQSPPLSTQSPSASPPAAESPSPSTPALQPGVKPARPELSNQPKPATTQPPASTAKYATLYVSLEGLNVRKKPGLKSETVAKLTLYEPVTFLNQKTEWTQEISLGSEKVTDHWVKVRTQSGKEGWVFGAGVHYYKMKRQ